MDQNKSVAPVQNNGHKNSLKELSSGKSIKKIIKSTAMGMVIPDKFIDMLLNAIKNEIKDADASCIMLYVKENPQKKDDDIEIITMMKDPNVEIPDLKRKLADDYEKLRALERRNNFLEPKYQEYLQIIQDPVYQAFKKQKATT